MEIETSVLDIRESDIADPISSNEPTIDLFMSQTISRLIGRLDKRARDVLSRRFGINGYRQETLDAIAESWDISRERVRQIQSTALKAIRNFYYEEVEELRTKTN
jgi:DNA-directed RNA polymerase sigma subunit (sigma70/sigma32)